MNINLSKNIYVIYLIILLVPVFFLLNGDIYYEPSFKLNLQNNLYNVPIPASYFISIILIFYFFYKKNFKIFENNVIKILIFSTLSLLVLLIFNKVLDHQRIINLVQFLLPWMGLVVALNIKIYRNTYKIIYYFLIFFLSLQLLITFFLDKKIIFSDILFFTIYQNIQYVGTIFTLLTILVSINLFKEKKLEIIFLNVLSLIYSMLTYSLTSLAIFTLFFLGYFLKILFDKNKINIIKIFLLLLAFSCLILFFFNFFLKESDKSKFIIGSNNPKNYFENMSKYNDILDLKVPENISLRIQIYKTYFDKILDDKKILLLGDSERELDKKFMSSHNLLLDIIYKFGFILIVPYLYLFFVIFINFRHLKNRRDDYFSLLILLMVIIIENIFKLSLKQPYPGIICFYLIGYYLKKTNIRLK